MTVEEFATQVIGNLPFEPTGQQTKLIAALSRFCSRNASPRSIFLLNGYAGTGKTSVTSALVKTLKQVGINSVLQAEPPKCSATLQANRLTQSTEKSITNPA